jgi:hypothetical protein
MELVRYTKYTKYTDFSINFLYREISRNLGILGILGIPQNNNEVKNNV